MKTLHFRKSLEEISLIADFLWHRGWAEGNAGNISYNITDSISSKALKKKSGTVFPLNKKYNDLRNSYIWLTAAGTRMRELTHDIFNNSLIVNVLDDGESIRVFRISDLFEEMLSYKDIHRKNLIPTSELPSHLAIHNFLAGRKMKERVVLHTHPTELIALTQIKSLKSENKINQLLWGMHTETKIMIPGGIGFVPFTVPGSGEIASLTVKAFEKHKVIIWEKHGCIAIGEDITGAFDIIDVLVKSVNIFFMCKTAGYTPEGLTPDQINRICKLYSGKK